MSNLVLYQACMISILGLGVTACNQEHLNHTPDEKNEALQAEAVSDSEPLTGKKLIDVAGQAAVLAEEVEQTKMVSDNALPYVGRYHSIVDCKDPIVFCKNGAADLILNLLPDGTAHRTIIHSGTITFASEKQYRQDHWKYDEVNHQIILHRGNGVEFFYDIDQHNNLKMNLEKLANASDVNRKFFQEGNPFPHEAYVLKSEK